MFVFGQRGDAAWSECKCCHLGANARTYSIVSALVGGLVAALNTLSLFVSLADFSISFWTTLSSLFALNHATEEAQVP